MKKIFVYIITALMVVLFLAASAEAGFTLTFEGKALVAGYREAGSLKWNIIKDCNIYLKISDGGWRSRIIWFRYELNSGELLINSSNGNYTYNNGTTINGFLWRPDGMFTIESNNYK